jgi:hypothetical protein
VQQTSEDNRVRRVVGWVCTALVPLVCLAALYHGIVRGEAWAGVRKEYERQTLEAKLNDVRKLVHDREIGYEKTVEPVLGKRWNRRDPDAVSKAIKQLDQDKVEMEKGAEILRSAGPYEDADAELARKTRLELLEARIKLFEMTRECLQRGEDWKELDENELSQQKLRVRDLEHRYRSLLKGG